MKKVIYTGLLLLACDQSYGAAAEPTYKDCAFIDATEAGLLKSRVKPASNPSRRRTGSRRVAPMPALDCMEVGSVSTTTDRTGSMSTATTPSPKKRRARGFSYAPAETASTADPKAVWTAADIKMANDEAVARAMEGVETSKAVWIKNADTKKTGDKAVAGTMEKAALEESETGTAAAKPVATKIRRRLFSGTPGGRTKAESESEDD